MGRINLLKSGMERERREGGGGGGGGGGGRAFSKEKLSCFVAYVNFADKIVIICGSVCCFS